MAYVKDFGAVGDGIVDDADAIQHAIESGEGVVQFGRGNYRISRTIQIDLAKHSRTSILGSDGVANERVVKDADDRHAAIPGLDDEINYRPPVNRVERGGGLVQ